MSLFTALPKAFQIIISVPLFILIYGFTLCFSDNCCFALKFDHFYCLTFRLLGNFDSSLEWSTVFMIVLSFVRICGITLSVFGNYWFAIWLFVNCAFLLRFVNTNGFNPSVFGNYCFTLEEFGSCVLQPLCLRVFNEVCIKVWNLRDEQ